MPPRSDIPLEQKILRLYKGDFERVQNLFPSLGAAPAIRMLIRNFCDRVEQSTQPLDIDLTDVNVTELLNE